MNEIIIRGSGIHDATWGRLSRLCELLYSDLHAFEQDLNKKTGGLYEKPMDWRELDVFNSNWLGDWVDSEVDRANREEYTSAWSSLMEAFDYLNLIFEQIEKREVEGLQEYFDDLFEVVSDTQFDADYYHNEIEENLEIIEISEGKLLYLPAKTDIHIPQLIISASDELLRTLVKNPKLLYSLHPRKFEELIAEVFYRNGYEVQLTKATRDGGKDIIAIYNKMGIKTKYIVECKRYSAQNKVSLGVVQRLLGVKIANAANKAILATTSTFTRDALEFRANHIWDLELKDYDDIILWLKASVS